MEPKERPACRAVERLRARRKARTELLPWFTPRDEAWPTGAALEDDDLDGLQPNYRQIRQDAVAASPEARTRGDSNLLPWVTPRGDERPIGPPAEEPPIGPPADEPVTFVWRTQLDDDSAQSSWRTQVDDEEEEAARLPWRWQTAVASPRLKAAIVIAERDTPRPIHGGPVHSDEEASVTGEEEAAAAKPQGPPPTCCKVCGGLFSSPVCRCSGMALAHPIERILARPLSPRPPADEALSPSLHRAAKRSRRWKEQPPPAPPPPPPKRWEFGDPALLA